MNRDQAHRLIGRILELPHDGELSVRLQGNERLGTRFNDCAISQNVLREQFNLSLSLRLECKQASITLNQIDDLNAIRQSLERVAANCRHMPDDDEVMPAPGNVIAGAEHAYDAASDALEAEDIGAWVAAACRLGADARVDLAGLLSLNKQFGAYGDSNGGFAHERFHRADYHVTATGANGSGWAEHQGVRINESQVLAATRRALDKCARAQNPIAFEPRPVSVILEPQAVGDLLSMAFWYGFDQRAKDEGRSAFANFDRRLGDLSLYSDPGDSTFPAVSFNANGERIDKSVWLDQGQAQQLITNRYWAKRQGFDSKPAPNNLILSGKGTAFDDLIARVGDGILVTRFWYIRATDPGTLGFTGMTRDGTFRIENGEITHPVVEMRWNESVLRLLQHVVASGIPTATGEFFSLVMPPLEVENFNFSSLSS